MKTNQTKARETALKQGQDVYMSASSCFFAFNITYKGADN